MEHAFINVNCNLNVFIAFSCVIHWVSKELYFNYELLLLHRKDLNCAVRCIVHTNILYPA